MCIAILSTAHPSYKLILINNRDEYLTRPTAQAQWWPPSSSTSTSTTSPTPSKSKSTTSSSSQPPTKIFGGYDLLRSTHGTWLGITTTGKIGVLTNFREDPTPPPAAVSRGEIIKLWLTSSPDLSTEEFVKDIVRSGVARDAGGFSLVCGLVGEGLAVISNRADKEKGSEGVPWIFGRGSKSDGGGNLVQTVGLSNTHFGDRSWKKVVDGEEGMLDVIGESVGGGISEDEMIQRFLELLSRDTLVRLDDQDGEGGLETYIKELRNTILVPLLGKKESVSSSSPDLAPDKIAAAKNLGKVEVVSSDQSGLSMLYATQKQTVVLVDHDMNVRFFERTLYDENCEPVPKGQGDVDMSFKVER